MIKQRGVGLIPTERVQVVNQTGAVLVVGGCYALDVTNTQAVAAPFADTDLYNLVAVATANLRGIMVIADSAIAIGATGNCVLTGRVQALVDGTTNVASGDALIAQNGSPNLIKQGSTATTPACGMALAAQTGVVGTLTDIFFDGAEMWRQQNAGSTANVAIVADSTTLTGDPEAIYDAVATIPANTLKAGDIVKIKAVVRRIATNASETMLTKLWIHTAATLLGGTALLTSGAVIVQTGGFVVIDFALQVRSATKFVGGGSIMSTTSATATTLTAGGVVETTFDATVAQFIGCSCDNSSASGGDTAVLALLSVEIVRK